LDQFKQKSQALILKNVIKIALCRYLFVPRRFSKWQHPAMGPDVATVNVDVARGGVVVLALVVLSY